MTQSYVEIDIAAKREKYDVVSYFFNCAVDGKKVQEEVKIQFSLVY